MTAREPMAGPTTPVQIVVPHALLARLEQDLAMRGLALYGPLKDGEYVVGAALPDGVPVPRNDAKAVVDLFFEAAQMLAADQPEHGTRTPRGRRTPQ
uniref:hypothetical protein n=1 Tax=Nonomuraea sp. CA-251285 TaxID=3240002 RepID=UPI003F499DEE